MEIINPIFIVGSGRSGTTILYELLAGHKELGWFSNYTNKYPRKPILSTLNRFYKNVELSKRYRKNKYFPSPSEGHIIWDYFHPVNGGIDRGASPPLFESDIANADINLMKKTIIEHIKGSGGFRFINKNTRNTRRMLYLQSIFPDCYFIHVIRDGRAVVNSLINVDWWKILEPWFKKGRKTVSELIEEGENEHQIAAQNWKNTVTRALEDSKKIPNKRYLEIRYEELTENPVESLEKILSYANLEYNDHFRNHVNSFSIKNMNYKYKQNFTENEFNIINNEIDDLLKSLEYK